MFMYLPIEICMGLTVRVFRKPLLGLRSVCALLVAVWVNGPFPLYMCVSLIAQCSLPTAGYQQPAE